MPTLLCQSSLFLQFTAIPPLMLKQILYYIGGLLLVAGAAMPLLDTLPQFAPWVFTLGALPFAYVQITQANLCGSDTTISLRRLYNLQKLAALLLVLTGILMFNAQLRFAPLTEGWWKFSLSIAALLELYTSLRIPAEEHKASV